MCLFVKSELFSSYFRCGTQALSRSSEKEAQMKKTIDLDIVSGARKKNESKLTPGMFPLFPDPSKRNLQGQITESRWEGC